MVHIRSRRSTVTDTSLTQQERARLHALGLSDEEIDKLKIGSGEVEKVEKIVRELARERAQQKLNSGGAPRDHDAPTAPPQQPPSALGSQLQPGGDGVAATLEPGSATPEAMEHQSKPGGAAPEVTEPNPDLHEGFIPREALTTRAAQKAQPEPGRAAPEAPAGERNPDAPSLPAQQQCLVAALDYAVNRSWDVFPVPPGEKKSYKSAKHSGGANGERRATRSRSEKILPNGRTPMSGSRRA